jgi:hypothetical protein
MAGYGFSVAGLRIFPKRVFRAGGDAGAVPRASSDHYEFLPGVGRQGAQGFLSSVIENQDNGLAKVRQTFLARLALPIGARHFSAIGDIPWAVSLDDRREFVARFFVLRLPAPGFASAKQPQHVGDEENQQYGPQPYAGASTITPAAVAVVPATAA